MFNQGVKPTMNQLLNHRDRRAQKQLELLNNFKTNQLVVLTLNMPGPIKNNAWLSELFHISIKDTIKIIQQTFLINHCEEINEASGLSYFIAVSAPIKELKQTMIELEETHPFGRLIDVDVVVLKEEIAIPISREVFGDAPRKCYICEQPAKFCARNRTHSLEELQTKILTIYQEAKRSLV